MRPDPMWQKIENTAWSGVEYLHSPLMSHAVDTPPVLAAEPYKKQQSSQHITPEGLCEFLRSRGFGDPRKRQVWDQTHEQEQFLLPEIEKHRKRALRIPYYMEKVRGQARMECDLANNKAAAFCEREKKRTKTLRLASANYRFRLLANDKMDRSTIKIGFEEDAEEEEDFVDEELFQRVQKWIDDVEEAQNAMELAPPYDDHLGRAPRHRNRCKK